MRNGYVSFFLALASILLSILSFFVCWWFGFFAAALAVSAMFCSADRRTGAFSLLALLLSLGVIVWIIVCTLRYYHLPALF